MGRVFGRDDEPPHIRVGEQLTFTHPPVTFYEDGAACSSSRWDFQIYRDGACITDKCFDILSNEQSFGRYAGRTVTLTASRPGRYAFRFTLIAEINGTVRYLAGPDIEVEVES